MPAEEAHVARLLRRDGRQLLELFRPLREDVELLREVSELTRLGRGRAVSAGIRRSIRHGWRSAKGGASVCNGVTVSCAARDWNGGSRRNSLTLLAQVKWEKWRSTDRRTQHAFTTTLYITARSRTKVEKAACKSLAEGEPPPPDFERRRIHQHDLALLAKLGHEDHPHALHRLVFALGRRLGFDQARLEARLVPDKVDVRRLMQDERVSVRKRETPCAGKHVNVSHWQGRRGLLGWGD